MARDNYIDVALDGNTIFYATKPVYQYDRGIKLRFRYDGGSLPQLHWTCNGMNTSLVTVAEIDGRNSIGEIPSILLAQKNEIKCYVYVGGNDSGYTIYEISIPLIPRAKPSDYAYTEEELTGFQQLMNQLNNILNASSSNTKLDVNQGAGNKNKLLIVGGDGNITFAKVTELVPGHVSMSY